MSEDSKQDENAEPMMAVQSTRFGELSVPASSLIQFPSGLIGFPRHQNYVLLEHKQPFSWLHSVDDAGLAFVVVDGAEFGEKYNLKPPMGDPQCDFKPEDEYAILVIVTVRPDPSMTTANLKAPLFVNIRNRKGVQVIFDDSRYSTRHPLWSPSEEQEGEQASGEGEKKE
ncbi:MAG: flagellar assembly protein FliW [Deltaproteobacteria bacterium]|nr:flagellar assembly protein FliW [Deltaproteobacteria bacterium]